MENYKSTYTGSQIDTAIGRALPGGAIDTQLSNKVNGYRGNAQDLGYTKLADIKGDGTYLISDGPSYLTDYPAFLAARGLRYATLQVCNAADTYFGKILYAQNAEQTLNAVAAWCGPAGWIDIATATPPTEYDLPCATGYEQHNVDMKNCFSKASNGLVLVFIGIKKTDGVTPANWSVIANLPPGYRPDGVFSASAVNADTGAYAGKFSVYANGNIDICGAVGSVFSGFASFYAGNQGG